MAHFSKLKKDLIALLRAKLATNLYYHGLHHTIQIYNNVITIGKALKIKRHELTLLKVAVLFHDAGFLKSYQGHEVEGSIMAREMLPKYQFSVDEINLIVGMIEATKIPQMPKTLLEQILADADLLYLGTDDFFPIGHTLYLELEEYFGHSSIEKWNEIQINFLLNHTFHTDFCKENYEPKKQENLKKLMTI